ncbi:hypothetical protein AB6C46_10920 [Vibrio sp. 10N.237.312.C02]|uniref:hypothetical protein n=1 Tax=Vibrio TaxID=662 RepID=UPI001300074C|nr:hypothetical protein [Vibrio tasmaniensis]
MKPFIKQVIDPASNASLFSKKCRSKRVPKCSGDRVGTRTAYRMAMKRDLIRSSNT